MSKIDILRYFTSLKSLLEMSPRKKSNVDNMSLVIGQCLVRIATSKFTNPESASITLFIRSSVLKSVFTLIYLNSSSNLFLIYELKKSPSSLFFETIFPT